MRSLYLDYASDECGQKFPEKDLYTLSVEKMEQTEKDILENQVQKKAKENSGFGYRFGNIFRGFLF